MGFCSRTVLLRTSGAKENSFAALIQVFCSAPVSAGISVWLPAALGVLRAHLLSVPLALELLKDGDCLYTSLCPTYPA